MNKFYYEEMSGEDGTVVVFNKEGYTKEAALQIGRDVLASICDEWKDEELVVFESFTHFGFVRTDDGERVNAWSIADLIEPVERKRKTDVAVWCVRLSDKALGIEGK